MQLYMIRHGESMTNMKKLHSGWAQVSLSKKGIEDARRAGLTLQGITFDKVYCSDLLRAKQTADIALPGIIREESMLLREINVGSLSGKSFQECQAEYGESYFENKKKSDYKAYGGEDDAQLRMRVEQFVRMLEQTSYETVAVFCHEGVIRMMLDIVTGVRQNKKAFACDNGGVFMFEYNESVWKLRKWNM